MTVEGQVTCNQGELEAHFPTETSLGTADSAQVGQAPSWPSVVVTLGGRGMHR